MSEGLPEFHAEGAWLIHEQSRPARNFRRNRAIVAEIGEFIGQILADQRNLEGSVLEGESRVDEPIGGALARLAGIIVAAEAAADVGIIGAAHQVPAAGQ